MKNTAARKLSPVTAYAQACLRWRGFVRDTMACHEEHKRLAAELNRCYDRIQIAPQDEAAHASIASIEAHFSVQYETRERLRAAMYETKQAALTAIGTQYGTMASGDMRRPNPDVFKIFTTWWRAANDYRATSLDGIHMKRRYDPDGNMFKAFVKAAGIDPKVLSRAIMERDDRARDHRYAHQANLYGRRYCQSQPEMMASPQM